MSILGDLENSQLTLLEVLYEVGFNSKSSFNTVFKKQKGMTPTQFRRSPKQSVSRSGSGLVVAGIYDPVHHRQCLLRMNLVIALGIGYGGHHYQQ